VNDSSCLWQEKGEEGGGGGWKIPIYCKRKLSFSCIPKDFLIPHRHRIRPVAEKSLPKKGRLNMKCLLCVSDFLFLTSAEIVKELMEYKTMPQ